MKTVISADELAKDVAGAEALLERHQEHKGEIDAREDSFKSTAEAGQSLLENNHYASEEVKEKVLISLFPDNKKCFPLQSKLLMTFFAFCVVFQLVTLAEEKTSLLDLWEERRILYEQCMDLQLFYRDTEQADAWMSKQEVSQV